MLEPTGPRSSPANTRVVHVDDGFDFLGFHIRRTRHTRQRLLDQAITIIAKD
jgi:hypothetical protein